MSLPFVRYDYQRMCVLWLQLLLLLLPFLDSNSYCNDWRNLNVGVVRPMRSLLKQLTANLVGDCSEIAGPALIGISD